MRLYMRIPNLYMRIPIHKIKFDNRFLNIGQPELRVLIDREYEDYFLGHTPVVTFEDADGKVIFQAMWSKLNFRWYESDFDKFNGIEIVARELEVPDVGRMSKEYTQKVLKKYSKISFDKKIPTWKEIREQEKLQELIEMRKRAAAPRLLREKRMRMRYYPIFLQSKICCEYYLYYLKTRKSILNKRFIKLFKIKSKMLATLLTPPQFRTRPKTPIAHLKQTQEKTPP